MGTRLFISAECSSRFGTGYRLSIDNWLHEALDKHEIPVNIALQHNIKLAGALANDRERPRSR